MSWLLPFSALFPLVPLALSVLPPVRRRLVLLLPFAALPALAASLLVEDGAETVLSNALMGSAWRMDPLGRIFLLFTAFCWTMAGLSAVSAFRDHPRRGSFAVPFLIAMAGNLALPAAADAVTFYTGFAVMGFAAWALVAHRGTPGAVRAGRVYLFLVLLGELLVLPGLAQGALGAGSPMLDAIRTHWNSDPMSQTALGLIVFGFALKAGLFPLHFWLPLAHPAAPAPASAVLSGCMIKAGLLAWLRLLPLGDFALPELGRIVAVPAAFGLVGGLFAALFQAGPKALLAYSSLSKMGLMMLLTATAMLEPTLAPAALAAAVTVALVHALHKCALFLGAGLTPGLGSGGRVPLTLLALSFAGAPLLSGTLMKTAAKPLLTHPALPGGGWIPALLLIAATLAPAVMYRFARLTWPRDTECAERQPAALAAWGLTGVAALLFPWWIPSLDGAARSLPTPAIPGDPAFWLGAGATALAVVFGLHTSLRLPPGDLLYWLPQIRPARRDDAFAVLKRIEHHLNHAPGGLAYLLILLLLLGLLGLEPL